MTRHLVAGGLTLAALLSRPDAVSAFTPLLKPRVLSTMVAPSQLLAVRHPLRTLSSSESGGGGEEEAPAPAPVTELSRLEIRVGRIVSVEKHPTLQKIFVEQIDLGEEEPRTICSGLQGYLTEADLLDKDCVVLCNLKPRDLEGTPSNGMILCASNEEHTDVQLVSPPAGVPPGELVTFDGHAAEPVGSGNRAVKAFKKVKDCFVTDAEGVATFTGEPPAPMQTTLGPCTSVIKGGTVS